MGNEIESFVKIRGGSWAMVKADGLTSWLYGFIKVEGLDGKAKVTLSNMQGTLHYSKFPNPIENKKLIRKLNRREMK